MGYVAIILGVSVATRARAGSASRAESGDAWRREHHSTWCWKKGAGRRATPTQIVGGRDVHCAAPSLMGRKWIASKPQASPRTSKQKTNSESVVIIGGKTAQDYDAIETLLRRVGKIDFFNDIQEEK